MLSRGVDVRFFNANKLNLANYVSNRLHAKILVIDRRWTWIGGRNMALEYFGGTERPFADLELLIDSKAFAEEARQYVLDLSADSLSSAARPLGATDAQLAITESDLIRAEGTITSLSVTSPPTPELKPILVDDSDIRLLRDPINSSDRVQGAFGELLSVIGNAKSSIEGESAYFVPTAELFNSLKGARDRGVTVKIATNSALANNQPLAAAAYENQMSNIAKMTSDVYEYQDKTLHSKYYVIDGLQTIVSSMNLNNRSQLRDYESGVMIRNTELAKALSENIALNRPYCAPAIVEGQVVRQPQCSLFNRVVSFFIKPHL